MVTSHQRAGQSTWLRPAPSAKEPSWLPTHRSCSTTLRRSLLGVYGAGPIVAALILRYTGDPARFLTKETFASYNGTAPIEASSGPKARHRLNPRGNRKLNHAMHLIAVTQIRNAGTPGRVFCDRKLAEGKTKKAALRVLKRPVSDAVWRQLQSTSTGDGQRSGWAPRNDSDSSVTGSTS